MTTAICCAASMVSVHQRFQLWFPGARQDYGSCLSWSIFFVGISFNLLEVANRLYFPFLLSYWIRSRGGEVWDRRETEISAVGFQNAFSLSFHLQQI